MDQVCIRCGKTFATQSAAPRAICPECEPAEPRPVAAPPSRHFGKDILIVLSVLVLLGLLVCLFLRPGEHARDIVFGDLGRRTTLTNGVVGGVPAESPEIARELGALSNLGAGGIGTTSAPSEPAVNGPGSERLTRNQSGRNLLQGVQGSNESAADMASAPGLPRPHPATGFGDSNSVLPGARSSSLGASSPESPRARSSSLASSPATGAAGGATSSPSQTSAPVSPPLLPPPTQPPNSSSATSSFARHTKSAPFVETLPPDPPNKDRTAELLAAANPAVPPTLPRTADLLGNNGDPVRLFDAQAGSNVVFILDNSLSMKTNGKSFSARRELVRTLQSMNPAQTFYVLLFHSGGYEGMPSLGPMAATLENVRAMTNWLFSVGYRTGADPTKAVQRALGLAPAPDTIWLLSGGEIPDKVIDNLREANAFINAHINTVGFYTRDNEPGLRQIADENRGAYRFIPSPNSSPP